MLWYQIAGLRVLTAHIASPILMKKVSMLPSMSKRINLQFFYCTVFSLIFLLITNQVNQLFDNMCLMIAGIGVINSLAVYAQWKAVSISLSKTALFTIADDAIAIILGFLFLGEIKDLNIYLIIGMIICFATALVMGVKKSQKNDSSKLGVSIFIWIAIYSLIWGIAVFSMRYFALKGVQFSLFLFSWYGGSYLGSFILIALIKDKKSIQITKSSTSKIFLFLLSIVIWLSMVFGYWLKNLVLLSVSEPIFLVTEMIFPALIGLFYFKEIKTLSRIQKIIFPVAIIGLMIIMFSYK